MSAAASCAGKGARPPALREAAPHLHVLELAQGGWVPAHLACGTGGMGLHALAGTQSPAACLHLARLPVAVAGTAGAGWELSVAWG